MVKEKGLSLLWKIIHVTKINNVKCKIMRFCKKHKAMPKFEIFEMYVNSHLTELLYLKE